MSQRHRRQFLTMTAGTMALGPLVCAGASPRSEDGNLTLGFSTYGMKTLKTEQALRELAGIGFDSVELTVWPGWDADSDRMGAKRRRSLQQQLQHAGLKLISLMEHLHIDADNGKRRQRLERVKLAAGLAHDLAPERPPLMQTTLGGAGTWQQHRERYAQELAAWLKVAESTSLTIAIKPHRGGAMSRPEEAVELIRMLGNPRRLKICYDYIYRTSNAHKPPPKRPQNSPYSHISKRFLNTCSLTVLKET